MYQLKKTLSTPTPNLTQDASPLNVARVVYFGTAIATILGVTTDGFTEGKTKAEAFIILEPFSTQFTAFITKFIENSKIKDPDIQIALARDTHFTTYPMQIIGNCSIHNLLAATHSESEIPQLLTGGYEGHAIYAKVVQCATSDGLPIYKALLYNCGESSESHHGSPSHQEEVYPFVIELGSDLASVTRFCKDFENPLFEHTETSFKEKWYTDENKARQEAEIRALQTQTKGPEKGKDTEDTPLLRTIIDIAFSKIPEMQSAKTLPPKHLRKLLKRRLNQPNAIEKLSQAIEEIKDAITRPNLSVQDTQFILLLAHNLTPETAIKFNFATTLLPWILTCTRSQEPTIRHIANLLPKAFILALTEPTTPLSTEVLQTLAAALPYLDTETTQLTLERILEHPQFDTKKLSDLPDKLLQDLIQLPTFNTWLDLQLTSPDSSTITTWIKELEKRDVVLPRNRVSYERAKAEKAEKKLICQRLVRSIVCKRSTGLASLLENNKEAITDILENDPKIWGHIQAQILTCKPGSESTLDTTKLELLIKLSLKVLEKQPGLVVDKDMIPILTSLAIRNEIGTENTEMRQMAWQLCTRLAQDAPTARLIYTALQENHQWTSATLAQLPAESLDFLKQLFDHQSSPTGRVSLHRDKTILKFLQTHAKARAYKTQVAALRPTLREQFKLWFTRTNKVGPKPLPPIQMITVHTPSEINV